MNELAPGAPDYLYLGDYQIVRPSWAFPMISLSSPFASYSSYGTQIVSERKSVR